MSELLVMKRDDSEQEFKIHKVQDAVGKAMMETDGGVDSELILQISKTIQSLLENDNLIPHVEQIQDEVENQLMMTRPEVAKRYILYRDKRNQERYQPWKMTELQESIWENKYRFNGESFDEFIERISNGNKKIEKRIRNKEFLHGGRILANRGLHKHGKKVTYSNCYVLTPPEDSIEGIYDTAKDMARTYSYGGGVGISIRNLRPRGTEVHNASKTTSGAVSFMDLYSLTTGLIGQNGRRGALMISIPSKHPDLEEFINVKSDLDKVTKANISIEIDNEFMIAVRENKPYLLEFETEHGEKVEKKVDARRLFNKLAYMNWDYAEPGTLFWDRISNYHFMSNHPDFEFSGTNPCAEEPLPSGGSCLLGSINLSAFVVHPFTDNAYFDFNRYKECIADATEELNLVLDEGLPLHPLKEQRESVAQLRQIGLGVMGIGEMLIKLGMTYGSTKSLALCDVLSHVLLVEATKTSSLIAKEKGSFDWYDYDYVSESAFFQENLPPEVKLMVEENGLRNSQILCIAPTGSISTMLGISGGIEPIFARSYMRETQSLHNETKKYKVYTEIVKELMDAKDIKREEDLPEYVITSHELDGRNRVEMQAVWQKHIDASISSTVNISEDTTVEQVEDLYMYAWEMGLKGITVFRDNCKRLGILTLDSEDEENEEDSQELDVSQDDSIASKEDKGGGYFTQCNDCGSDNLVFQEGCKVCLDCGWSPC